MSAVGATGRTAGLETAFWTKPSDQRIVHGPGPVSATERFVFVPAHAAEGPVRVAVGGTRIGTVAEPSAGQPPLVTVTPSCTVPLGPAVKVIERPVEEPTMLPFPIRQL